MDHRIKVRQRFSGFYNLSVKQDGGATDIDGANFDAEQYVTGLLKHKQLSDLIAKSNELSGEIKELDSDMQMLVYENYHKFMVATDTIQLMKDKVDGMSGEMAALSASVHDITATSTNINTNLADRRVRIQKLNGVRRLLKKLSFIFDLPTRLSRAVELDACAEAVKYWSTSLPVIRAYSHVPAFVAVDQESSTILVKLRTKLLARLSSSETAPDDLHEAASLLLQLDEPVGKVRDTYLNVRRSRLQALASSHSIAGDLSDKTGPLSLKLLNETKDLVLSYHELFLATPLPKAKAPPSPSPSPSAASAAAAPQNPTTAHSGGDVDPTSLELILELVQSVTCKYIQTLRGVLTSRDLEIGVEADTYGLVERLEQWHDAVRSIDAILPAAKISALSDDVVCCCGKRRIDAGFDTLEEVLEHKLARLCRESSSSAPAEGEGDVEECVKVVVETWGSTVERLRGLMASESHLMASCRSDFGSKMYGRMASVLKGWPAHFLGDKTDVMRRSPRGLCAQTAFFLSIKRSGLEMIFSSVPVAGGDASSGRMLQETAGKVTAQVDSCARALAKRYVHARSSALCATLCSHMGLGSVASAASSGGGKWSVAGIIGADVADALEDLRVMNAGALGGEGEDRENEGGGGGADVEFDAIGSGMMCHALHVAHLRTVLEAVRAQTHTTDAYHRVVVQVHGLRSGLKQGFADDKGTHLLLDEIVAAAAERCQKPTPLSTQQIQELCSE